MKPLIALLAACTPLAPDVDPTPTTPTTTVPAEPSPAEGIRVAGIEVNQGVGILVWDGSVVPVGSRVGPLIAGRDAMIRVLVELDPGFTARDIETTLSIGSGEPRSLVQRIEADSDRDRLDGTINFSVSGDDLGGDAALVVELLEVGNTGGDDAPNRVPATGAIELDAWTDPMALVVDIMPCDMTCGDPALPITASQRQITEDHLMNVFPVRDLHVTWRDEVLSMSACSNRGALDELQALRVSESAGPEHYYHCVFRQSYDTLMAGGYAWLLGDGPGEARVSLSVNWWGPKEEMVPNVAHELGHNHGRSHPWTDDQWQPVGATETGCNDGWGLGIRPGPHPTAYWSPQVTDPSAVIMPPSPDLGDCDGTKAGTMPPVVGDFMGYSHPQWVDTYTWRALAQRIRTVSAFEATVDASSAAAVVFGTVLPDGTVSWTRGQGEVGGPRLGEARLTLHDRSEVLPMHARIDGEGEVAGFAIPLPGPGDEGVLEAAVEGRSVRLELAQAPHSR